MLPSQLDSLCISRYLVLRVWVKVMACAIISQKLIIKCIFIYNQPLTFASTSDYVSKLFPSLTALAAIVIINGMSLCRGNGWCNCLSSAIGINH